jgi:hypothetical protein
MRCRSADRCAHSEPDDARSEPDDDVPNTPASADVRWDAYDGVRDGSAGGCTRGWRLGERAGDGVVDDMPADDDSCAPARCSGDCRGASMDFLIASAVTPSIRSCGGDEKGVLYISRTDRGNLSSVRS